MCGRSDWCGNTRSECIGPRIRPRDLARLEALWVVSSGPPNPRRASAALAGEVNPGPSTCVSLPVIRRARPRTSCRVAGTARWCLTGDRERQRLGETVKALPVESCQEASSRRHDAEGQRSVRGFCGERATIRQSFGDAGDPVVLRCYWKAGRASAMPVIRWCFGSTGSPAELRQCRTRWRRPAALAFTKAGNG